MIGLYRTTPEGRILMANPALVHMLGYSSFEDLRQRSLDDAGFKSEYPRSDFKERIENEGQVLGLESAWLRQDGTTLFVRESAKAIKNETGKTLYYEGTVEDITERKKAEKERVNLIFELQDALAKVKTLTGLIPICSSCKKIRDDTGYWNHLENFIREHSEADFSHSICPECMDKLYPGLFKDNNHDPNE